ncbi:hypothetical protein [Aminivibrio sp.]|jgi:hypothetical protein|uniref:hypothetical protein n=1 Tax=Aminivibrio sp. TaxID=1872489 RepID=UPI0016927007|nr:hypothetical protein [Synergistaceae bacterium]
MNEHDIFEEMKRLLDSEGLVTARLVESVTRTSQFSAASVPEIQMLFRQWLSLICREVKRFAVEDSDLSVSESAQKIGISPSSFLSLLLYLQRSGEISIESVLIGKGTGKNEDICSCLLEKDHH